MRQSNIIDLFVENLAHCRLLSRWLNGLSNNFSWRRNISRKCLMCTKSRWLDNCANTFKDTFHYIAIVLLDPLWYSDRVAYWEVERGVCDRILISISEDVVPDLKYCLKSIIFHPAKVLMKRCSYRKKMVVSIMVECSTSLGACMCWYMTRLQIKISVYNVNATRRLHNDWKTDRRYV